MSKDHVVAALDNLSNLYALRDRIQLDKKALLDAVLTQEIRQKIADIEAEFADSQEEVALRIQDAEREIKTMVLEHGETVTGQHLQAVYVPGRTSWDTERLTGYATAHPEIVAFCKQGNPSVTLRKK